MTAYKTIAQNLADTSARMEAVTAAAHASQADALAVVDKVVKENAALKAKVAELEAKLASRPGAISIGGGIAVPSK